MIGIKRAMLKELIEEVVKSTAYVRLRALRAAKYY